MKKALKIGLIVAGLILLVAVVGFIAWGLTPLGPTDEALVAMESNSMVSVQEYGNFVTFTPAGEEPISGFIFYPGGHVDYRSYAPIAREIAGRGYFVAIAEMPLSLAVFGINRADEIVDAYPDIRYWVIGGHSLGGSMAANYASNNTDTIQGLVLWASYPSSSDDLSGSDLKGLSTYGSSDEVLNMDNLTGTLPLLPPGSIVEVIDGGNHAQFGNYGPQPGDGVATITAEQQQLQATDLTVRLIRAVEGE